jgi:uncharacterized protein with ATP-grasp and redox domains
MSLAEQIETDAPLALFERPAPDTPLWHAVFQPYSGESWLATEWLFAEFFAYRLIVEAVRYWDTLEDPFAPFKREELASAALKKVVLDALNVDGDVAERLRSTFEYTLWGNQMDQSIKHIAERGMQPREDRLLSDHMDEATTRLLERESGEVHLVLDNAGTEQALDFVLVDLLLRERLASRVRLHVKQHPILVSDVIEPDVGGLLVKFTASRGEVRQLAGRLTAALEDGRITVEPDFFWNLPRRFWELPLRLESTFRNATLVLVKGDANYRRMTNDAIWPYGATLSDALPDFPSPLLALRTLKSDTLVGVDEGRCARLDEEDPDWRTNGKYAVAQFLDGNTLNR